MRASPCASPRMTSPLPSVDPSSTNSTSAGSGRAGRTQASSAQRMGRLSISSCTGSTIDSATSPFTIASPRACPGVDAAGFSLRESRVTCPRSSAFLRALVDDYMEIRPGSRRARSAGRGHAAPGSTVCGLSGFVSLDRRPADCAIVRRMAATLRHRGPDDEGYYVDGPVALGHRRLTIIDLATGRQPIGNESGTVHAMLNGEIYNYRNLTETLRARGHRFATSSDTETIVHAWEEYGEGCLAHFNGMFALVLWDAERQTLFAARDRLGEKPLYYAERNGWVVFASEIRALLAHPEIGRDLDLKGLARYLASGYLPDPSTILEGVRKLPAGHALTVARGQVRVERYWDLPLDKGGASEEPAPRDPAAWAGALWDSLCASVRHRLVSDVPVGIFLSGGIDSSAITAAARAVAPGQRFKSFSIGFEEPTYSEERFARTVARHLGTEHHQFTFTAADALALLPRLGRSARRAPRRPGLSPHPPSGAAHAVLGDSGPQRRWRRRAALRVSHVPGRGSHAMDAPVAPRRRRRDRATRRGPAQLQPLRKSRLPAQAVLPRHRPRPRRRHPDHDGRPGPGRAASALLAIGPLGLRRVRSPRRRGRDHGRRSDRRSHQSPDLSPLQAVSGRPDAREDGPRHDGLRGGGPRALPRSRPRGAGLCDTLGGEAQGLDHEVRAEARPRRATAPGDPHPAEAGLRGAHRPVAARSPAAAARGGARPRAGAPCRAPRPRAHRDPGGRARGGPPGSPANFCGACWSSTCGARPTYLESPGPEPGWGLSEHRGAFRLCRDATGAGPRVSTWAPFHEIRAAGQGSTIWPASLSWCRSPCRGVTRRGTEGDASPAWPARPRARRRSCAPGRSSGRGRRARCRRGRRSLAG